MRFLIANALSPAVADGLRSGGHDADVSGMAEDRLTACYKAWDSKPGRLKMHPIIAEKREDLAALCRQYGIARLDLFGSAARGKDFDASASDVDFLVEFGAEGNDLTGFFDFKEALESLLARPIDLVDRKAVEASRNPIRRRHILAGAEVVYAA